MKTTKTTKTSIANRVWGGGQTWFCEEIHRERAHTFRFQIRVDSVADQGYGLAELWTNDGWTEVTRIAGQVLMTKVAYQKRVTRDDFASDLNVLENEAHEIVLGN